MAAVKSILSSAVSSMAKRVREIRALVLPGAGSHAPKSTAVSPSSDAIFKFFEERRQRLHQGRAPTPGHATSIWDTSFIPDRYGPATDELIAEAEKRLKVSIPASIAAHLLIQNGGCLRECEPLPFEEKALWMNAAIDGILSVQEWELAAENNWFENVQGVADQHLLILVAAHSESQLCLDYRKSGPTGVPSVTYIDVCTNPIEEVIVADTVEDFVRAFEVSPDADEVP